MPTRPSVREQIRYDHLTWEEINEATALKKMVVLPIGAIQQHGPHLPVDTDMLIVTTLALAAAERRPERSWSRQPCPIATTWNRWISPAPSAWRRAPLWISVSRWSRVSPIMALTISSSSTVLAPTTTWSS